MNEIKGIIVRYDLLPLTMPRDYRHLIATIVSNRKPLDHSLKTKYDLLQYEASNGTEFGEAGA